MASKLHKIIKALAHNKCSVNVIFMIFNSPKCHSKEQASVSLLFILVSFDPKQCLK